MKRFTWNARTIRAKQDRARDRAVFRQNVAIVIGAKANAPVRTGEHRDSIGSAAPGQPFPRVGSVLPEHVVDGQTRIGAGAPHSWFVERGTSRMRARPHILPAVDAEAPHFRRRLREEYRKEGL